MRTVTASGPRRPGAAPRLADAVSLDFPADSPAALDLDVRVFFGDMARPYGLPLDEDRLGRGAGQSYAEMGEAVITALVPPERPVDLLVEVFASPDVQPGRAASVHLSTFCPGRPFAFALTDQGTSGVFSALRLAGSYLADEGFARALVLVLEQSGLPYRPPDGTPVADRAAAVGLLLDRDAGIELAPDGDTVRVPAAEAYERVAKAAAELRAAEPDAVLLLGPALAELHDQQEAESRTRAADLPTAPPPRPGNPYTGLWSALAGSLPRLRADRSHALLAEYDPLLGLLDLARLHVI
ncbi:MAG TPA: hypothetical protein VGL02_13435 [Streptomyces sp.]